MEDKNISILDNFINQFKMINEEQTDPSHGRDGQGASTSAIMAQTDQPPIGQNNFSGQKNEATLSEERKKKIEFCQLLWEGASEKVTKANSETEANGNKAPDDPAFQQEDMTLRRKIWDELQNPNVNFRNFALLVYRWRDMHLNRVMPKKQTLGIPSWQAPSCGTRGEDEGAHES
jgi:hypothetical protein